ncbi:MAG: thiol peroxidase [Flaviflexus sp.]|nr:thiol peroxidase [Flaviflexus sp.]
MKLTRRGVPVTTVGDLPASPAPDATFVDAELTDFRLGDIPGRRILSVFPSIDTGVCAASVRRFNQLASELPDTTVLCISNDLPFALGRFCGAEGIDRVRVGSAFRSSFGRDYGLLMDSGPLTGLLARAVLIIEAGGEISYSQVVPEIGTEPNYDEVIAHLH